MVNSELFRKIADRIETEPETYNQGNWARRDPLISDAEPEGACIFCIAEQIIGFEHHADTQKMGHVGYQEITAEALGLSDEDATKLYHADWKPREGLTVPQALRMIADGATVSEVSA